jgi:hypothetical protein
MTKPSMFVDLVDAGFEPITRSPRRSNESQFELR